MVPFRVGLGDRIEPNWVLGVRRIEVDDVVYPTPRHLVENRLSEIPMGIDERDTLPGFNILQNRIVEECRLTRAGLADDVDVVQSISIVEHKIMLIPLS